MDPLIIAGLNLICLLGGAFAGRKFDNTLLWLFTILSATLLGHSFIQIVLDAYRDNRAEGSLVFLLIAVAPLGLFVGSMWGTAAYVRRLSARSDAK